MFLKARIGSRMQVPGCITGWDVPFTIRIPAADRLYYQNESSLQAAGFKKSDQCDLTGANGEAVSPGPSSPAPASETPPPPVPAKSRQVKNPRKGFWFNAGLGYGTLGCEDCDSRQGSVSGSLALGERSIHT